MSTERPVRRGRIPPIRSTTEKLRAGFVIVLLHIVPLTLFFTGTNRFDWLAFALVYVGMIFGVGGALHRYFAHRSFKTTRTFQFVLGSLAGTAFGDPIGFSGKHRIHHKFSDIPGDVHSPRQGLWHCWIGSLLDEGYPESEILAMTEDLTRYPELMWLHRHYYVPALSLAAATYAIGGYTMFATAFCLGFVVVLHATSAVNYWCHRGTGQRYDTGDDSVNRPFLSFFILGEGWHNNHHFYPSSARAGFHWYELDPIFAGLRVLSWFGLIWDLKVPPQALIREGRNESTRSECELERTI